MFWGEMVGQGQGMRVFEKSVGCGILHFMYIFIYTYTHVFPTLDRDQRIVVGVLTDGLEPIQKDDVRPLFIFIFIFIVYWRLEVTRCLPLSSSVCLFHARTHARSQGIYSPSYAAPPWHAGARPWPGRP